MVVDNLKIVIAPASGKAGTFKANAEFHALDGRNTINDLSNAAFYTAEHGFADAGGKAGNGTFDNAAYTIPGGTGLSNEFLHGLAGIGVQHRKIGWYRANFGVSGFKVTVTAFANGQNMSADADAHFLQPLLTQTAGDAQRSG